MMKLALLGSDSQTLELLRSVAAGDEHEVVWTLDFGEAATEVEKLFPAAKSAREWEPLLEGNFAEAVVVAHNNQDDQLIGQLRLLVQAAIPLLVSHPVSNDTLVYYELDMIRQESGCVMMPYVAGRWHPALAKLSDWVRQGEESELGLEFGKVEQIVFDRWMPERNKVTVLAEFIRDVDLIQSVCGEVNQLGAMGPSADADNFANLGVQMSGAKGILVRWSVGPADHSASENQTHARLSLLGSKGKAEVNMPWDTRKWSLERIDQGGSKHERFESWVPGIAALENLSRAIAGEEALCDWGDACRSVELADAVERSLDRGRTIELHDGTYTEQGVFKGLMGMIGFGLLLLGLFVLVTAPLAGSLLKKLGFSGLEEIVAWWPHVLLTLLVLFLLLQLMLKLALPGNQDSGGKTPNRGQNSS